MANISQSTRHAKKNYPMSLFLQTVEEVLPSMIKQAHLSKEVVCVKRLIEPERMVSSEFPADDNESSG